MATPQILADDRAPLYRHFKGKKYMYICKVIDRTCDDVWVLYQPDYGEHECWLRPYDEFFGYVMKSASGMMRHVPRFERIPEEPIEVE